MKFSKIFSFYSQFSTTLATGTNPISSNCLFKKKLTLFNLMSSGFDFVHHREVSRIFLGVMGNMMLGTCSPLTYQFSNFQ